MSHSIQTRGAAVFVHCPRRGLDISRSRHVPHWGKELIKGDPKGARQQKPGAQIAIGLTPCDVG